MSRKKFRISGSGGQGVITLGIILAEAAIQDGKLAVQSQSYGPEARGGASKCEVIISDEDIFYPKVIIPDVLISMSQKAAEKYGDEIEENGIIIVDSSMVENFVNEKRNLQLPSLKLQGKSLAALCMQILLCWCFSWYYGYCFTG
jgi:2-oxoglutarate ferredoxin oxidoreductase subunit gamma